ncbi:MAG TPA: hypothetical protein DET40_05605 [Lentisphaeria bacterium]|nr:MAG: hypothetical protein A2X45_12345 [Lentisphaerae bacterium GWF2_50_93]HCE43002.1 hypothetical protein [Lentisphaeria bacterium]
MKNNIKGYFLSLAAVFITVALVLLLLKLLPPTTPYPSSIDVQAWMTAVEKGDMENAIASAGKILQRRAASVKIRSDYLKLAGGMKLDGSYFSTLPDKADFLRWESAFIIKNMLIKEFKNLPPSVDDMFKLLQRSVKLKPGEDFKHQAGSPAEILLKGYGNTHELTRLLCEMAYQEDFEAQTISIFNEKGEPLHILCEFRKNGSVDTVDIRFGKSWHGRSFADLLKDKSLRQGIWPEQIEERLENSSYGIPAEPQDFKLANQHLFKYALLSVQGLDFRFGSDPGERIENYLRFFPDTKTFERFTYWRYPFIVMMAQAPRLEK